MLVCHPGLLLGHPDHLESVGEHPVCMYDDLCFSLATLIIYSQLESSGRYPGLLVCRPGLLLGHPDHLQSVGEYPACTYDNLCFSLATLTIYSQLESSGRAPGLLVCPTGLLLGHPDHLQSVAEHPACTNGNLGFSSATVILYELWESSWFARMSPRTSPWPP